MDDDLQPGDTGNPAPEGGAPAPSLMDVLSDEFGFGDDGEVAGGVDDGQGGDPGQPPTGGAPIQTSEPGTAAPGGETQPPVDPSAPKPGDKPDPNAELYAPLPEHNPRKTVERFNKLVEGHKTVTAERDAAVKERDTFKSEIQRYEAGLQPLREMGFDSPEAAADLRQFAEYRNAMRTGNVDAAMGILQQQLEQLALASGRRVEVNPLQQYPDLAERVRVGDLDEPTALQLARSRHGEQVSRFQQERQRAAETQHQQQTAQVLAGAQAVNETVLELMKSPDYQAVEQELIKQLPAIKANYLPHQWAQLIKQTFDYERRLLVAQQTQQQAVRPAPLRGSGHPGGTPTPKTAADAAMQALGIS